MMMLLRILSPLRYLQVHCSQNIGVIYKFIKCSAVPQVELGTYKYANIFGASYELDTLHIYHLKNIAYSELHF